jgi:hypothetical protein
MNTVIRKTLIASSIAAALALPAAGTFAQTEQGRDWDKDNKKSEMHDQKKSKPTESTLRGNSGKVVTDTPDTPATAAANRDRAQDHNAQAPKRPSRTSNPMSTRSRLTTSKAPR